MLSAKILVFNGLCFLSVVSSFLSKTGLVEASTSKLNSVGRPLFFSRSVCSLLSIISASVSTNPSLFASSITFIFACVLHELIFSGKQDYLSQSSPSFNGGQTR